MGKDDAARVRLGRYVRRRRIDLGLSIDEAAILGGKMSPTTWSRVEQGKKARELTYGGVERALKLASGSVRAILAGGEPTPTETEAPEAPAKSPAPGEGGWLTPEEEELIEKIRRDPAKRQRLLDAILAGSGLPPRSTKSDPDEGPDQRKYA